MSLPILLPPSAIPTPAPNEWRPKRYLDPPKPPPVDEAKIQEQELANARNALDGKMLKKTRPRRTVDFNGGMGRWNLLKKLGPNPRYRPYMRPSPPHIIDLLPPKAYPENASTSLLTKYVHTSTNKIRCPVNVVTWTPEARRILTGSTSGEFTLWNGLTFNFETILQAHDTAICTFEFCHSGHYLASADKTGVIKYFEPNMNNLNSWQGSNSREAIRGLSFSPDDRRFATASDDSSVRIWSFHESRIESVLTGHGWDVKCVQWHPTKGLLVSGSKDNQIKYWDPRTGTCLSTLHYHKNTIQALAWSPNGNQVASASRDQTVRVFDIRAMKELHLLKGHKKEVCSVSWHPIHPVLVSGGSEGAVMHWDLGAAPTETPSGTGSTTLAPRAAVTTAHDSNVWSLAYHPLGHLLVSASNDHTTRFWSRERPAASGAGEDRAPDEEPEENYDVDDMPGFGFAGRGPEGAEEYAQQGHGAFGRQEDIIPGFGGDASFGAGGGAGGLVSGGGTGGGGIRQGGPLPPQQSVYHGGFESRGSEGGDDWGGHGGGGGGRPQRGWGQRRGGRF